MSVVLESLQYVPWAGASLSICNTSNRLFSVQAAFSSLRLYAACGRQVGLAIIVALLWVGSLSINLVSSLILTWLPIFLTIVSHLNRRIYIGITEKSSPYSDAVLRRLSLLHSHSRTTIYPFFILSLGLTFFEDVRLTIVVIRSSISSSN